jgi:mono/diheme cytochrome c family protein
MKSTNLIFTILLCCLASLFAEHPGQTAYKKVCIVCHGIDGNGVPGGVFPPITNSAWVKGDPRRAINIVVFGLEGALTVKGKDYSLLMPPQGAMLDNKTISDILNFVRTAWNKEKGNVTPAMVQKVRESRKSGLPWQAKDLEKAFPLPKPKSSGSFPLKGVMVSYYEGDWNKMPDFSKLEPKSTQEWKKPLTLSGVAKRKYKYGLVWEGTYEAKEEGLHMFDMGSDDGSFLLIDGKKVIDNDGLHGMNSKRAIVKLTKGSHKFRLEFFQKEGGEGISLMVKTPSKKRFQLTAKKHNVKAPPPEIELKPEARAMVIRQFIKDTDARGIAVGHPEKLHFTFDPQRMGPAVMWSGNFFNAGNPWTGRGTGYNNVYSDKPGILKFRTYPFAELKDSNADWPEVDETLKKTLALSATSRDSNYRFRGYQLDEKTGRPTFFYDYKNYTISEVYTPKVEEGVIMRKVVIKKTTSSSSPLIFQLTQGHEVKLENNLVTDGNFTFRSQTNGIYRTPKGAVRIPVNFSGDTAEIVLSYQWEK